MGDRANVQIIERGGGTLFLYTHWGGHELPTTLATALFRGKDRWDDEEYLSRIIFSEMIRDDVLGETGFGLSTTRGDYEYDDLVVNMAEQTVTDRDGATLSFDDFVAKTGITTI